MRHLFLFDAVDADGRVIELGCIAETDQQATRMLSTEGYDVSIRERVDLSGLTHHASTGAGDETVQRLASTPDAVLKVADPAEAHVSGSLGENAAEPMRAPSVATLARDIAILDIYGAGLDIQTVARAVGGTPREVAIRLSHRVLHLDVEFLESATTPPFGNSHDASVIGRYRQGMSVTDIAEATGQPALEIAWALLDDPTRPLQITIALSNGLRAEMFQATHN